MLDRDLELAINMAFKYAREHRYEFMTVEQLLLALLENQTVLSVLTSCQANVDILREKLTQYIEETTPKYADDALSQDPQPTLGFQRILQRAVFHVQSTGQMEVNGSNVLLAIFSEQECEAVYLLNQENITRAEVINFLSQEGNKSFDQQPQQSASIEFESMGDEQAGEQSALSSYATNLNKKAKAGKIDPVVGRNNEITTAIQVLCRRRKNNPLLVGEAGVGKTAIAEGLAKRIIDGEVPEVMSECTIYSLDLGSLLAGTKYRGDFEKRLKQLLDELQKDPKSVLFIDEIHNIIGAGAAAGGVMDASNLIKPMLASGELKCMGSTTFQEYRQIFEKDRALARRFHKIDVKEPSVRESVDILLGLKHFYEEYHNVKYSFPALKQAAKLSNRYVTDRQLPDKAIDVIDEAGAAQQLLPENKRKKIIGVSEVETVVAKMAGVPAKSVSTTDQKMLRNLTRDLKMLVYGQDKAIDALGSAIRTARSGLNDINKPVGSFIFTGPTGVGKTEVARQLSNVMGIKLLRYDMSEYMESHAVSRLIGSPPGYVGYEQGGLLTEDINQNPYCILLLDEIEKAHPDIYNLLLQVMDNGTLTDNNGRTADFRHVILIMTTNAGAESLQKTSIGFSEQDNSTDSMNDLKRVFTPEFRNRLDAIVQFDPLSEEMVRNVVGKFLMDLEVRMEEQKVSMKTKPAVRDWLAKNGYDPLMGARPMARLIKEKLKKPLAEELLFGKLKAGSEVMIDVVKDEFKFTIKEKQTAEEAKG
tara:strand:- start:11223 stop:13499 length:2277 start_codon:yes stop_codon:yes gene_type:complete